MICDKSGVAVQYLIHLEIIVRKGILFTNMMLKYIVSTFFWASFRKIEFGL